ncbi:hypothetical protein MGG_07366 [Paecilomyces variotii No. 5]|uniref:Major facilitator superfamily (MFS) profile domain-containing protein n=1 Tax=Byssochlamys spectabilis (strain No. 5 / NBRC 109023) TaxID=1356009 RepID=V5I304_BYSSN|nr:hypothetical protein MGG_07366 [Paecilomyces variotii No. 5]
MFEDIEALPTTASPDPQREDDKHRCHVVSLEKADIDRLGRQKPDTLKSSLAEIAFVASVLLSTMLAEMVIGGFNILLPPLSEDLNIARENRTWPSNAFSLVSGALLLPFGRLGDMYGGYYMFLYGNIWMAVWSLIAGFSQNYVMLVVCRALQGIGSAAFMPAGVMLLGSIYRPGPRKNTVFSLYGGCAPFGFFIGILIAGVCAQYLHWEWFFWIGGVLQTMLCVLVYLSISHQKQQSHGCMDCSHHGWTSPEILVTLCLGLLLFFTFILFKPRYMKTLFLALFLVYGSFGIYLLYASFYIETILDVSPILTAVWFSPMVLGGITIAVLGGVTLHRLSGTVLIMLSTNGSLVSVLLFALIPAKPNYWAWILPAMVSATIGIDIMYNVTNVFITSNVPREQQGIAGAYINALFPLGMSFFLGVADNVASATAHLGLERSYKSAFFLGVGLSAASTLLIVVGVRIGKAKSDLTFEEKEQLTVKP